MLFCKNVLSVCNQAICFISFEILKANFISLLLTVKFIMCALLNYTISLKNISKHVQYTYNTHKNAQKENIHSMNNFLRNDHKECSLRMIWVLNVALACQNLCSQIKLSVT